MGIICGDEIRVIVGEHRGLIGVVEAISSDGLLWGSWGVFPLTKESVEVIKARDLW